MNLKLDNIKKYFTEMKLGVFFLVAFIVFFFTLISIRELTIFRGTYVLKVKFNFAEGLRPASPVRFCGVDVGDVEKIEVKEENLSPVVYVYAKVYRDIRIPQNSNFFINSLSLFGEKYLEIMPTTPTGVYLKGGDTINGISPIPLFDIFMVFNSTMEEVKSFIKEGKLKTSLEATMDNLEKATGEIKLLVENMKNKQGTIGRLLYDDSIYKKTEELFDDLKAHPWKLLYKPKEEKSR